MLKAKQANSILELRTKEANQDFAEKAKEATIRNQAMGEETLRIALRTVLETVSMRVITLVTLFYLPGTFISVSH